MAADTAGAAAGDIQVLVVYSPAPRQVVELPVQVPTGTTVALALEASGLLQRFPELVLADVLLGIWGRKTSLAQPLRAQDRVEIYRLLTVDPKVARRERFVKQGARAAGLFARRRAGAKPGY